MKRKLKLILLLIACAAAMILSTMRANHCIDQYAETVLKNKVYSQINESVRRYTLQNSDRFALVASHVYDNNGVLVCISLNSAVFNSIKAELEQKLIDTVTALEATAFYVPCGSLTGLKLFSDIGPRIKFKIVPLGTITCDTINTFNSVGINHTVHSVGLSFKIAFRAAAPFGNGEFEAKFDITVCESIIIGKVPSVYFN